ncbi:potassium channel family protein [Aquibacillus koreensis]|uniref:Potassium channel family protein n=1 Tax=Aquibacillus koreensis TaxID=279446 RepID=A0A9X3WQQ8_9BACI|nr:potassium channel family protein [Aquibacillus koreensis]MCT2537277.1 potassium channel family protein [Aquibacillus koreensis]MDC3421624.1 potassium channel family protein [Aquibacillus koreensis]
MKFKKFGMIYELTLAGLVIFSLVVDIEHQQVLDWFIWMLFVIDYVVRFSMAEKKWQFVKSNPLDLIAIIPLDQIFKAARLVRLVRVIRLLAIFRRRVSILDQLFQNYNIDRFFTLVIVMMFIVAIPMRSIEPSFESYGDTFWWVIVTTTTVGYGDFYPETAIGRIIATFLMIVGIGVLGVVTGTVASFFTKKNQSEELPDELEFVKTKLEKYPDLSSDDYDLMVRHLEKMKSEATDLHKSKA